MNNIADLPPKQRTTRKFFIASEDTYAVKQYFERLKEDSFQADLEFRRQVRSAELIVFETTDGRSQVMHLCNRLKESVTELAPSDQLWVVCDMDNQLEILHTKVKEEPSHLNCKFQFAISNPCFELWLFLHHSAPDTSNNRQPKCSTLQDILSKKTNSIYHKNPDKDPSTNYWQTAFFSINYSSVIDAMQRAEHIDTNPGRSTPNNPGTRMYQLMQEIIARKS